MAIRVIISDTVLTGHPESVRAGVLAGYGNGLTAEECRIVDNYWPSPIDLNMDAFGEGYEVIIQSLRGLPDVLTALVGEPIYTSLQWFMPLGSNSHEELTALSEIPFIVTCGAGTTQNGTGYGAGLEFWDDDLDQSHPDYSSYSTGRIAGKMLKVKDVLNCTWDEARLLCRATASNGGVWDKYNGYGKINVDAAILGAPPTTYTALTRIITHAKVTFSASDLGNVLVFYGGDGAAYIGTIATFISSSSIVLALGGTLPSSDIEVFDLSIVQATTPATAGYASYVSEVLSMVKDNAGKLTLTDGGDIDRCISKAVADYSKVRPLTIRKKIQGNGTDSYLCRTALGSLWKHGASSISEIEYPIGSRPKIVVDSDDYELYDDGTAQDGSNTVLRFDTVINASEYFIVSFTTEMCLPKSSDQNFPNTKEHFSNITTLASAYACQRLAAVYAQSIDATISADSVNYNDKSSKYQALAKQYMRQYNVSVFGSEDPQTSVSAAIVTRVIDTKMSTGSRYLFHRERR